MKEDRSSSMYFKNFSVGQAKIVVPTYILTEISAIFDQNNGEQPSTYCRKLVHGIIMQLFLSGFRGICNQAPVHCIIMEFCPNGQLYEVLRNGRQITPSLLIKWSKQIADGMHYLHLHKIIHRDLKSPT